MSIVLPPQYAQCDLFVLAVLFFFTFSVMHAVYSSSVVEFAFYSSSASRFQPLEMKRTHKHTQTYLPEVCYRR